MCLYIDLVKSMNNFFVTSLYFIHMLHTYDHQVICFQFSSGQGSLVDQTEKMTKTFKHETSCTCILQKDKGNTTQHCSYSSL